MKPNVKIRKSSGELAKYSEAKLKRSLYKSGAGKKVVSAVLQELSNSIYSGISTAEIYSKAFELLKRFGGHYASRYSLKKAIYELGPSGFPFERFIAELLKKEGYTVQLNVNVDGRCVTHEVDIIAEKDGIKNLIECKFHSEEGRKCDVKVPLYINSRFRDIFQTEKWVAIKKGGWVVTNTSFSKDAEDFGNCVGLQMLSWNYPETYSLKQRIDELGMYPVTISTLLTAKEKQELLDRHVILGWDLFENDDLLNSIGVSNDRKQKVLAEFRLICKNKSGDE